MAPGAEPIVKPGSRAQWSEEVRIQLQLAGPLALTQGLSFANSLVSLAAAGSCGPEALAAAGLASSLATATGRTVLMGLVGATSTTASQAAGAGRRDLLGLIYRRSALFLLAHCIPIFALWLSALLWLPRLTDLASGTVAAQYLALLGGDLLANALWRPMSRVLAAQRVAWTQLWVLLAVVPIHLCATTLLVARFGVLGAAAATSLSGLATSVLLALAVAVGGHGDTIWGGATGEKAMLEAKATCSDFKKLAYPAAAMRALESWGMSGMVTISALLPDAAQELRVMSLALNVYSVAFMPFVGLGQSANTRTGNELGKGSASGARFTLKVALALLMPSAIAVGAFFLMPGSPGWVADAMHVAAQDVGVRSRLQVVFQLLAIFSCLDGLQNALAGAIRGMGKQREGAGVCLAAYGLAIPIAVLLGLRFKLGSVGLWLGMMLGPVVQVALYSRLLLRMDWEAEAAACAARLRGRSGSAAATRTPSSSSKDLEETADAEVSFSSGTEENEEDTMLADDDDARDERSPLKACGGDNPNISSMIVPATASRADTPGEARAGMQAAQPGMNSAADLPV